MKEISLMYNITGEIYKSLAYSRAEMELYNFIEKYNDLPDEDELFHIYGIGPSIRKDIIEYYNEGKISRLNKLKRKTKNALDVIGNFMEIDGIGIKKAVELYEQGYRYIDELQDADLTIRQRNNLRNYELTTKKLSRRKMTELCEVFYEIFGEFDFEVVGSYRRNKAFSKDIDLLFNNTNMDEIVNVLVDNDLLYYIISKGENKMSGLIYLDDDSLFRIDIMVTNDDEWFTSLLYFTGPKQFNIDIRTFARDKGFKLNEHGLYKNDKKINIKSEKDIFNKLNLEYIPPYER